MSIHLYPNSHSTFTQHMNTGQMSSYVNAEHFADQWAGVPLFVRDALTLAIRKQKEKGAFRPATLDSTGTTLRDIRPYLQKEHWSVIELILGCNYYGLFDCRP